MLNNVEVLKLGLESTEINTQSFSVITECFGKNNSLKVIELNLSFCKEIEATGFSSLGLAL